jgi:RNA polymerase sigma-70 factor (ECF subfamily)
MEHVLSMSQWETCEERMSELDDIDGLVVRYRAQVLRLVAFSLDDSDEAASVTQDCFLKAYVTRAQYRGQCAVSSWLLQIAYNLIRDRVRTRKFQFWRRARMRAVDLSELASQMPSGASSSESQLLARERVDQVWAALRELSPRQRSVFVLRFVEEMELPEIVAATGMSPATVKTHLYRALHAVRSRIDDGKKGSPA